MITVICCILICKCIFKLSACRKKLIIKQNTLFNTTWSFLSEQRQEGFDNSRLEGWTSVPSMLCCKAELVAEDPRRTSRLRVGVTKLRELRLDTAQLTDDPGELLLHLLRTVLHPGSAKGRMDVTNTKLVIARLHTNTCTYSRVVPGRSGFVLPRR